MVNWRGLWGKDKTFSILDEDTYLRGEMSWRGPAVCAVGVRSIMSTQAKRSTERKGRERTTLQDEIRPLPWAW